MSKSKKNVKSIVSRILYFGLVGAIMILVFITRLLSIYNSVPIPLVDYSKFICGVEFEEEENSLWINNTNDITITVKIVGRRRDKSFLSASRTSESIHAIVKLEAGQSTYVDRIRLCPSNSHPKDFRSYYAYISNIYGTQIGYGKLL